MRIYLDGLWSGVGYGLIAIGVILVVRCLLANLTDPQYREQRLVLIAGLLYMPLFGLTLIGVDHTRLWSYLADACFPVALSFMFPEPVWSLVKRLAYVQVMPAWRRHQLYLDIWQGSLLFGYIISCTYKKVLYLLMLGPAYREYESIGVLEVDTKEIVMYTIGTLVASRWLWRARMAAKHNLADDAEADDSTTVHKIHS